MSVELTLNVMGGDECQEDVEYWIEPVVGKLQELLDENLRAQDGRLLIDVLKFHFAAGEPCGIHVQMTGHIAGNAVVTEYHVMYLDRPRSIWDWILNRAGAFQCY